ncbi:DUF4188 domain-containing protein [Rhodobacteraceae bacterium 2CG4]|uniref:DUF4188 domain-containing protein n=1 Tax=Halovulum marinum TaxID=2662447 RepID=A0A6L5YWJ8_9RHOB|nr:DUF4188 domain-containing protein [Halovulum marinum]MSU88753.1 DUF4188 domain-containing protein [Halovulum marinum]
MAQINEQRMAGDIDGDFVVFLIGMRINRPWKLHKWLPVVMGMPRMLKELDVLPAEETGFLGHNGLGLGTIVQYWRSFDHLEAYARSKDHAHFPAWIAFNKRMKTSRTDVGIWHETYLVKAGQYEAIYSGMPPYGLGRISRLVPATGNRNEARARLTG